MPSYRHSSLTGTPVSTCFNPYVICSTENLDFRIASLPFQSLQRSELLNRQMVQFLRGQVTPR
jgi:hypothetical protein